MFFLFLGLGGMLFPAEAELDAACINRLRKELKPLSASQEPPNAQTDGVCLKQYRDRYAAGSWGADFITAYVPWEKGRVTVNIWFVDSKAPVVYVFHGYLEHSLVNSGFIRSLVEKGWNVVAPDLPGHGLSSGKAAHIDDFQDYGEVVSLIRMETAAWFEGPVYLLGQSTGASAVLEHLRIENTPSRYAGAVDGRLRQTETLPKPDACVLVSPLIRSYLFEISRSVKVLVSLFTDSIGRRYGGASSKPEFEQFLRNDPLQTDRVPFSWFDALIRWNETLDEYPEIEVPVLVLQGLRDTVVDYRYNIGFIERHSADSRICKFPEAKHSLLNERDRIMTRMESEIFVFLAGGSELNRRYGK
ncbi:MAG: lysophospholipase [Spirochaetales bacterium]|nr:lysophospholipase [Spirochaetales bacterium]MCF7937461.1 lysophospholipase [Spirochaetales bacterium]